MKKETDKIWTVRDVINWTTRYFEEKGILNPRLEVENILSFVLETSRLNLYLELDRPMSKDELKLFKVLAKRRLNREPLQYITKRASFWKYDFYVDKGVFIPRRETELLVEVSVRYLKSMGSTFIADVGTGTGCILLSILKEVQNLRGIGIDISLDAIRVFSINREKLLLSHRSYALLADSLQSIVEREIFDAIVSNPPYVKTDDIEKLDSEISKFEPRVALDGGIDGLQFIRRLIKESFPRVKKGGFVAVEVGYDQSRAVKFLMERSGFKRIEIYPDFSGIERVVVGWKL